MTRYVSVKILMCVFLVTLLLWYNERQKLQNSEPSIVFLNETYIQVQSQPKDPLDFKYILQWTSPDTVPFVYMGVGQNRFIVNRCKYTNCYVTSNRYFLDHYTQFDVIVFAGPEIDLLDPNSLPGYRAPEQKYVFASIESSDNYPLCTNKYDGYFNWTWTFKLDSENRWGYIVVRDKRNNIIGPNKVMHWMKFEDMDPVTDDFKKSLRSKTKAAAWFVSNCFTKNNRMEVATKLKLELAKYGLTLDIYGTCGTLNCPRDDEQICEELVKTDYYFYLAFENSCSEDYVTEKLLHGLQNNAIPIVYGGANYTRFMPDGIYLDATKLSSFELAAKMNELMYDSDKYAEYFRWQNHYSYHNRNENPETDDYCGMCALLNNDVMVKKKSVYHNLREWWEVPKIC